jgi:diketogulonate reductase-like aldo/keto reductase
MTGANILNIIRIPLVMGNLQPKPLLSWAVQRGNSVFPNTVHDDRMVVNISLLTLKEVHMAEISGFAEI